MLSPKTIAGLCLTLTPLTAADWPTEPESPLFIGDAVGPDLQRHSIAITDDGAAWISWQDPYCQGDLRLNRISWTGQVLAEGGIITQPDPTCGFVVPPELVASGNDIVLARAYAVLGTDLFQRFNPDGSADWEQTFSPDQPSGLAKLFAMGNGDTLLVANAGWTFLVDRLDAGGKSVWTQPTFVDAISPSANLSNVVDDGADGVFLFWDWHTTYRKTVRVTRVTADGLVAFAPFSPLRIGELEGISRHTPPVAIADGSGGAVFIWTKGFETAWTPAPLLMQRVNHDGTLAFPIDGHRIALTPERQFDPEVRRDPATNDLLVAWRDGLPNAEPSLHVQRITPEGDRLWGDDGVEVAPLDQLLGRFAPVWWNNTVVIPVTGPDGVAIHRVTDAGTVEANPWPISPVGPTRALRAAQVGDSLVVVWHTADTFENSLYAQRVNANGRLGDPACNRADFVAPFGTLNFFDVAAFLDAFSSSDPTADITRDGAFNIFDIIAFLDAFAAGCP